MKETQELQSYAVDFKGANKQFAFFEVSLVYDKSDQHKTLFDSYNIEIAITKTESLNLENGSNNYSASNKIRFDLTGKTD